MTHRCSIFCGNGYCRSGRGEGGRERGGGGGVGVLWLISSENLRIVVVLHETSQQTFLLYDCLAVSW